VKKFTNSELAKSVVAAASEESLLDIYKRALGMLPDAEATAQAAE
jgi:hypothetical protein